MTYSFKLTNTTVSDCMLINIGPHHERSKMGLCPRAHPVWNLLLPRTVSRLQNLYIHIRSESKLFNLSCLKAKSKIRKVLIRALLFDDDASLTSHSAENLHRLIDRFADACKEFGLHQHQEDERTSWVRMSATLHPSTSTSTS